MSQVDRGACPGDRRERVTWSAPSFVARLAAMKHFIAAICMVSGSIAPGCGDDATIERCEPASACSCTAGTDRETRCTCAGGSSCSVAGGGIEFDCQGNAACELTCGDDCLITCPGTTSCGVVAGDGSVVRCPGTASCDVTCEGDCDVTIEGAADAVVRCEAEDIGAVCELSGCSFDDCGDGVYACGTACPAGS